MRTFKIVTVISTVMLLLTVSLFLVGAVVSPKDLHLSFSDEFHVGVWGYHWLDSSIVFFNDAQYGPYHGSIVGPVDRKEGFGPSWGIYYRYFERPDWKHWTFMVSLWYPLAIFAIMPSISLLRWFKHKRTPGEA